MSTRTIDTQGAIRLVKAIVGDAKHDFVTFEEGTYWHEDAKQFFQSDYFENLTGLDGSLVLEELQAAYEERQKRKAARKGKKHDAK